MRIEPRVTRHTPVIVVCTLLAAVVTTSRLWLAAAWGSAVPFLDEWDVEPLGLYRPWLDGTFHWSELFRAHNEHRVVLTRLVDLGFFLAWGRWEPWAQIGLNALLHAGTAAALVALGWQHLEARARPAFAIGVALLFTATSGWQNALHGFQSQFYFSSLFAVIAIAGLTGQAPWTRGWWIGAVAAAAALFCLAGGVLTSVSALGVMLLIPPSTRRTKADWAAYALLAAVIIAGLLMFVTPAAHKPLRAQTFTQFYAVFARCLSWPYVDSPWPWLLLQLPMPVLLGWRWRQRTPLSPIERCALGLVIYSVLQAAAVAYSRGNGLIEARPLSRYQDPLLLGVAAQGFAALRLAQGRPRIGRLMALPWGLAIALGVLLLSARVLSVNLPYKRAQDTASLMQIRTYLKSHDAGVFTRDPAFPGPHTNPQVVEEVLDDPVLRPVLPKLFFTERPESEPGMKPWIIEQGKLLFGVALVGFGAALVWGQFGRSQRVGGD
jgi:hypothetical protein